MTNPVMEKLGFLIFTCAGCERKIKVPKNSEMIKFKDVKACPVCDNEEFSEGAQHCKICGTEREEGDK